MSYLSRHFIELDDEGYDPFADMMALGDGYMDAKWHSSDLEATLTSLMISRDIFRLVKNKDYDRSRGLHPELHYEDRDAIIRAMMGRLKLYTCADWRAGSLTLDHAQETKVLRINRKLELHDGMTVLDLGCGWGGYAQVTKQHLPNVKVVGVTLADTSVDEALKHCDDVIVGDFSEAKGRFDRVISLGMLEHLGAENYRRYMRTVNRCLKPNGISLFQTIGYNTSRNTVSPWINARIFPGSQLPSFTQLSEAMEGLFVLEDVENLGIQYARTAQAWFDNFAQAVHNGDLRVHPRFFRMWEFYIMFFKAAFMAREFQLWQCVFSKDRFRQAARI